MAGERSKKKAAAAGTDPAARTAEVKRETKETKILVSVNLDGSGKADNHTGIGFFDHMLDQLARHSLIDIAVNCDGDLHIDAHHTVEDVGWALGAAINEALGSRAGINRFGNAFTPMDEALTRCSIDLSQRPFLVFRSRFTAPMLGTMATELVREFFQAFAQASGMTLHIHTLYGSNNHHIAESCFKAVARAMKEAVAHDPRQAGMVPSTKGTLSPAAVSSRASRSKN
ncbi:MAG: imidazoleglycerol-phosphate dehydratase HisB [Alphaproteobacteria bacterium]|nr:imidazoleglycerol-phosphate dehydratase HisB [Alphaproteobacteria bacterium SS10]